MAWVWQNILWVMFAAILVYYFPKDFTQTLDDVKTGLSNGMIWALIALGYTLVYGIIELINFAHGEVFMIGSFIAVSAVDRRSASWRATASSIIGASILLALIVSMLDERLAQRDDRARRLQTAAQRAEAGAADHRDRHELHPPERRPALASDAGRRA